MQADGSLGLTDGWSLFGGLRYDLETSNVDWRTIGVEFDCQCMNFKLAYTGADDDITKKTDHRVMMSIDFATLGGTSFSTASDEAQDSPMNRFLTLLLVAFACLAAPLPASSQDMKVLVTVNDQPVTSYDVNARINLWKMLGGNTALTRKQALDGIISDIAKIEEAKKYKADPSDKDIDERLARVAKGLNTDPDGLKGKLKAQGVSMSVLRQYLAAQIAFGRLLAGKYKEKVDVTDAEVDAKMADIKANMNSQLAKIKADPRMQPSPSSRSSRSTSGGQPRLPHRTSRRYPAVRIKVQRLRLGQGGGIGHIQCQDRQEDRGRQPPHSTAVAGRLQAGRPRCRDRPFRNQTGLQMWAIAAARRSRRPCPRPSCRRATRSRRPCSTRSMTASKKSMAFCCART